MPKQKTKRAAMKRFKKTGTGKIDRQALSRMAPTAADIAASASQEVRVRGDRDSEKAGLVGERHAS